MLSMGRKLLRGLTLLLAVSVTAGGLSAGVEARPVKVGMGVDVNALDPTQTRVLTDLEITKHILQTLVSTDEGKGPQPLLATSWEVSEDGKTWTFKLREGVKFHDGTPFNAEAVKFNIDRFNDPATGTRFSSLLKMVKETKVVDEYTVQMTMDFPFSPLLLHLAYPATAISSPAAIEKHGKEYSSNPVGTGPFRFAERKLGEYIDVTAYDDYWGGKPKADGIRFIPIVEASTRIAALEAGDIDIALRIPYHEVKRLQANDDVKIIQTDSSRIMFMPINVKKKPLDDVRVRKALNYAVDKAAIAEAILLGNGKPVDSIVGPGAFGYSSVMSYDYDPEKAKSLLKEADVSNLELDFYYSPGRYTSDGEVAETVASYLQQIGIKVNMQRMEWSAYLDTIRGKKDGTAPQDLSLYGWGWASGDAHQGLSALFGKGTPSNTSFYTNDRVEELLRAQAQASDPEERQKIIHDLMTVIMEDAPWIFLVNQQLVTGTRKNVAGLHVPANEMTNLYDIHLTE